MHVASRRHSALNQSRLPSGPFTYVTPQETSTRAANRPNRMGDYIHKARALGLGFRLELHGHRVVGLLLLRRHVEIAHFEELAELDLGFGVRPHRVRAALGPLDGLLLRLHLEEPIARDDFLRLGEWTVDDRAFFAGELHLGALRSRLKTRAVEQ